MDWIEGVSLADQREIAACRATLDSDAPEDYRSLSARLALYWSRNRSRRRPARIGIAGGQGAGKSTLSQLISDACKFFGLRVCVLGLDDFYLTKAERRARAREIHPLLETRGAPGTHDLEWCRRAVEGVCAPGRMELPRFDKAQDDRAETVWVEGPFDLVLLEGWCIGAAPVSDGALVDPVNELERIQDADGRWRKFVNERLGDEYAALWGLLDELVFLEVPGLDAVRRWRLKQEENRPQARRLDAEAVAAFVEFYERITYEMLERMPARANWVVSLGEDHSVVKLMGPNHDA
jgi:D-glycerate 3-kinase